MEQTVVTFHELIEPLIDLDITITIEINPRFFKLNNLLWKYSSTKYYKSWTIFLKEQVEDIIKTYHSSKYSRGDLEISAILSRGIGRELRIFRGNGLANPHDHGESHQWLKIEGVPKLDKIDIIEK